MPVTRPIILELAWALLDPVAATQVKPNCPIFYMLLLGKKCGFIPKNIISRMFCARKLLLCCQTVATVTGEAMETKKGGSL